MPENVREKCQKVRKIRWILLVNLLEQCSSALNVSHYVHKSKEQGSFPPSYLVCRVLCAERKTSEAAEAERQWSRSDEVGVAHDEEAGAACDDGADGKGVVTERLNVLCRTVGVKSCSRDPQVRAPLLMRWGVPLAISTTGGGSETRALEVEGSPQCLQVEVSTQLIKHTVER